MADTSLSSHYVMSLELLLLFEWLIEHEQEALANLVQRAVAHGALEKLNHHQPQELAQELQHSVVDFLNLLEALASESVEHRNEFTETLHRVLIPAVKHLDFAQQDEESVKMSIAHTQEVLAKKKGNSKELLCKELLKRWKPSKKFVTH